MMGKEGIRRLHMGDIMWKMDKNVTTHIFTDRQEAATLLAKSLMKLRADHPIVLALPRGGVVLGYEIAKALHAPLSVIVARKIGLPWNPEFGIGAVSEEGVEIIDQQTIELLGITDSVLHELIQEERIELDRRILVYRNGKDLSRISGKTVILVDDGLATGVTANAAIKALKKLHAGKIIFASPVCARETSLDIQKLVSQVVCLVEPYDMQAIGLWYQYFPQVTDEEVIHLLQQARRFEKPTYHHITHI